MTAGGPDEPFLPAYGHGTLAEVMPSAAAALDVDGFADTLGVARHGGDVTAAGVLLVDGLGAELLAAHPHDAPTLTALADAPGSRWLTACFPSTTAVSITSLGTGLLPGAHGIEGYAMAVPPPADPTAEADLVLNTLRWCAHGAVDPVDLRADLPPEDVQPEPTVLERALRSGVAVTRVAPEIQRRSGLTRAALRGGRFHGVSALGDLAAEFLHGLAVDPEEKALCYGCSWRAGDRSLRRRDGSSAACRIRRDRAIRCVHDAVVASREEGWGMDRHEHEGPPVVDLGAHDGPSRLVRLRSAVAHRPLLLGGPLIAVAIVAGFAQERESSVVSLAAVVGFIVVQLFTLAHDDRLCLRCLAESPADPARAVERRRRWLRLFHSATTTAGVAVLVVAAAIGVTAGLLIRPGWGDLVLVLPLATMALTVVHRRIEPWCPYCGWGRDDDGEDAPEPTPDPDVAAPLTR